MNETGAEAWARGMASYFDRHLFTLEFVWHLCYAVVTAVVVGVSGRRMKRFWILKYGPMIASAATVVAPINRPTPAAQDPPPQTPQDHDSSGCSSGVELQVTPGQEHRRIASWDFAHHLWQTGHRRTPSTVMEKLHAPWGSASTSMSPDSRSHVQGTVYSRGPCSGPPDSALGVIGCHESDISMLITERENAEKQYVTEATRSRALKDDLERSLAMQEQLESRLAEEMSLRQSLEMSWRQREASLLAEVASATSQSIRSQTQTCDLEDELAHFQLRARQMATDSSVISAKVGRTGRELAEASAVLKSLAAHLLQLEDSVAMAESALCQANNERKVALEEVACMESKLQETEQQLLAEEANRKKAVEDSVRISDELERVVNEFAEFERQQFCAA